MHLFEPLAGDMCVYLRGGQITVPKQHLHHAQIRTVIEQMRRERVPQRVW